MNPLQDRLRTFVGTLGISVQEFERQCGIKAGTASRMTEKSYSTTFHKIQETYPQLNMDWLKKGTGEMLRAIPSIDVDLTLAGHSQMAFGDISNIGDTSIQIVLLKERIKSLEIQLAEKEERIAELTASLDRERKINDKFLGI